MTSTQKRWRVVSISSFLLIAAAAAGGRFAQQSTNSGAEPLGHDLNADGIQVQYLEIVTPTVQDTCALLAETHGIEFSDPIPELGNARTADLADGGRIGVRAPLRKSESPVVRPYVLVDDIQGAVDAAKAAGAEIAIPPLTIPGQGTFSIYILGGIEHGLWQI